MSWVFDVARPKQIQLTFLNNLIHQRQNLCSPTCTVVSFLQLDVQGLCLNCVRSWCRPKAHQGAWDSLLTQTCVVCKWYSRFCTLQADPIKKPLTAVQSEGLLLWVWLKTQVADQHSCTLQIPQIIQVGEVNVDYATQGAPTLKKGRKLPTMIIWRHPVLIWDFQGNQECLSMDTFI